MAAGNTLTVIDSILKELYPINYIKDQFEDEKEFYKRLKKSSDYFKYGGKKAIIPLRIERAQGVGSRAEDGDLPDARSSQFSNMEVTTKYNYFRGRITGQDIDFASGNLETFTEHLEDIMTDGMESLMKNYNFQLYRTSTGEITQVNDASVSAETTFTVDSVVGLKVDMAIDVYTATSGGSQEADGVVITDINESTKLVTVDTSVTLTNNSYIFTAGSRGSALNGLLDGVALTGTYHGIAKGTYSWFQGNRVKASAGVITDDFLTAMKTASETRGRKADMWLTTPAIKDEIWKRLLRPDRRYNEVTIAGGLKSFEYHGLPIVWDNDMVEGYVFLPDMRDLVMAEGKGGFAYLGEAETGKRLVQISGKDAYEFGIKNYSNLALTYPKGLPYISGVTTSGV